MGSPLPSELSEALAHGVTLLTANQRAARTLRRRFDLDRHAAGLTSWQSPNILAWDTWTATLWRTLVLQGHAAQLLLNTAQEHILWRAIIAADPDWQSLLPPDRLADLAADAWSRLGAYQGESRLRASATSADTRAFARWAQTFTTRCRAEDLLSPAQLESTLAVAASKGHLALEPGGYLLVGFDAGFDPDFDRITPAQRALYAAIRQRGVAINHLPFPAPASHAQLLAASDPTQELLTAAHWVRRHLEAHPEADIALIVSDLATHRPAIDRILRQTLSPERNLITDPAPPLFEFSLGIPLAQTPLAATALDLLRWAAAPLATNRISQLLLSPHIAAASDLPARAAFDAYELRRQRPLRPEFTLARFLRLVDASKYPLPALAATLHAFSQKLPPEIKTEPRSHADWADTVRALLAAAGWGTGLDSTGFQALQKWESTLDQLATLDFTGLRVSFPDTLLALERLAQQTLFAPESRNAPIQIMSPLESAGSTFDAVWFLGAGDATWPQRPATSPLLAWHLQRDLAMPGTDAARDLEDARRTARRIAASAPIGIFSYPSQLPDSRQRPSPALTGLSLAPAEIGPPPPPPVPIALETIDDSTTLPPLPDQILRGGAEVLKLQAACGFRAFAERRLFSTALDATAPGMDARDRGEIVHTILQDFWSRVQTQDALRALAPDARRALLTECIESALAPSVSANEGTWPAAFLDVQCERLLTVLDTWLLKELDRQVPFLVRAEELTLNDVAIGPLHLTLRVDRIDQTEFGDVILDYKTGNAKPAHWLNERPDEPQLPLYAVLAGTSDTALAGVAFANIRAGKDMALHGYQTQTGILLTQAKLKTPTLEDQIDVWRDTLTALAEDFHRGDLRVRPKAYPHTCQYCQQRLLCRLDITLLQASEEAGDLDPDSDPDLNPDLDPELADA